MQGKCRCRLISNLDDFLKLVDEFRLEERLWSIIKCSIDVAVDYLKLSHVLANCRGNGLNAASNTSSTRLWLKIMTYDLLMIFMFLLAQIP